MVVSWRCTRSASLTTMRSMPIASRCAEPRQPLGFGQGRCLLDHERELRAAPGVASPVAGGVHASMEIWAAGADQCSHVAPRSIETPGWFPVVGRGESVSSTKRKAETNRTGRSPAHEQGPPEMLLERCPPRCDLGRVRVAHSRLAIRAASKIAACALRLDHASPIRYRAWRPLSLVTMLCSR